MRHSDGCHPAGAMYNFVTILHDIAYTMLIMLSSILYVKFAKLVTVRYIAVVTNNT